MQRIRRNGRRGLPLRLLNPQLTANRQKSPLMSSASCHRHLTSRRPASRRPRGTEPLGIFRGKKPTRHGFHELWGEFVQGVGNRKTSGHCRNLGPIRAVLMMNDRREFLLDLACTHDGHYTTKPLGIGKSVKVRKRGLTSRTSCRGCSGSRPTRSGAERTAQDA